MSGFPDPEVDPFQQCVSQHKPNSNDVGGPSWLQQSEGEPPSDRVIRWQVQTQQEQAQSAKLIRTLEAKLAKARSAYVASDAIDPSCRSGSLNGNEDTSYENIDDENDGNGAYEDNQEGLHLLWQRHHSDPDLAPRKDERQYTSWSAWLVSWIPCC
ncbi:hypothetical protein BCR43DRAFT_491499 [Syncephalastrum racemosum]|uniref:Uncharacterized protein n=1 Tax=Syncephalastrum racemosum TaxID=13706 RepID=A0A1X2HDB2_SYNRA|nr:hypothetical protein BCR43DRAFT_491499 [Syncephalastrum racemosum]